MLSIVQVPLQQGRHRRGKKINSCFVLKVQNMIIHKRGLGKYSTWGHKTEVQLLSVTVQCPGVTWALESHFSSGNLPLRTCSFHGFGNCGHKVLGFALTVVQKTNLFLKKMYLFNVKNKYILYICIHCSCTDVCEPSCAGWKFVFRTSAHSGWPCSLQLQVLFIIISMYTVAVFRILWHSHEADFSVPNSCALWFLKLPPSQTVKLFF